jgi:hypothetical protein
MEENMKVSKFDWFLVVCFLAGATLVFLDSRARAAAPFCDTNCRQRVNFNGTSATGLTQVSLRLDIDDCWYCMTLKERTAYCAFDANDPPGNCLPTNTNGQYRFTINVDYCEYDATSSWGEAAYLKETDPADKNKDAGKRYTCQ